MCMAVGVRGHRESSIASWAGSSAMAPWDEVAIAIVAAWPITDTALLSREAAFSAHAW